MDSGECNLVEEARGSWNELMKMIYLIVTMLSTPPSQIYHAIHGLSDMHFDNIDFMFDSKLAVDDFNDNQDDAMGFQICYMSLSNVCKFAHVKKFKVVSVY